MADGTDLDFRICFTFNNAEFMRDKIIVVTGLSRCGSSLMMQMLHAGGYPISCEPGNERISGEHDSQTESLRQIALGNADGKAIKSLDPLNFPLPPDHDYVFFWMQRDYSEQAKSMAKFLNAITGLSINRKETRRLEKSLAPDTDKSIKYLKQIGEVHIFNFEDFILNIDTVASRIIEIIPGLDRDKMVSVLISRDIKCYDGLLEKQLLER